MSDSKWCESWEKNFDSTFKAIGKFKDDLKQKPSNLNHKTQKRVKMYIELLILELDEIQEQISIPSSSKQVLTNMEEMGENK